MTNKEIVDSSLELIRTCVECQYSKLKSKVELQNEEDFYHDLLITLYEYSKLQDAYNEGHLNALVTRIIINNLYSKTSEYHKKYRKFSRNSEELHTITDEEDED